MCIRDSSRTHQWKVNEDGNLTYSIWRHIEGFNSWWQGENVYTTGFYDYYDVTPNSISLGSESFFDSKTNKLNLINYNDQSRGGGDFDMAINTNFDTENTHKIKYWWKDDDDDWNSYLITVDSVFDDSTDISIYQDKAEVLQNVSTVSYTHLTLPTSDLV